MKAHHDVNRTEARTVSVSNLQHPNICGSTEHENPTAVSMKGDFSPDGWWLIRTWK